MRQLFSKFLEAFNGQKEESVKPDITGTENLADRLQQYSELVCCAETIESETQHASDEYRQLIRDITNILERDFGYMVSVDRHLEKTPRRIAEFWTSTLEYGMLKNTVIRMMVNRLVSKLNLTTEADRQILLDIVYKHFGYYSWPIKPTTQMSLSIAEELTKKLLSDKQTKNKKPAYDRQALYKSVLSIIEESISYLLDSIIKTCKITSFPTSTNNTDTPQYRIEGWLKVYPIKVYSWCAHHMAPMFGYVLIAYRPKNKLLGLSKLPRLAKYIAKQLLVQEEYTHELIGVLGKLLGSETEVVVATKFRHLCMEMRGIQETHSVTTYSAGLNVRQSTIQHFEDLLIYNEP